jgi:hypothetical protein
MLISRLNSVILPVNICATDYSFCSAKIGKNRLELSHNLQRKEFKAKNDKQRLGHHSTGSNRRGVEKAP